MLTVAWYLLRHYHRTTNDLKQESDICVLHNQAKKILNTHILIDVAVNKAVTHVT
jgi:hypothetical protein